MKKFIISACLFVAAMFTLTGCIKQEEYVIKDLQVEFDAASWNSRGAGVNYPILTRVPPYGMPVATTDPLISRASGTIRFRVNLIGAQQSTAQTITYRVANDPANTAVSGTHFTIPGTITIPANSSFGEAVVNVINPGVSSSTPVLLVLEVVGNSLIKPATEINKIGIQISQN
jgi:hypothetical protein